MTPLDVAPDHSHGPGRRASIVLVLPFAFFVNRFNELHSAGLGSLGKFVVVLKLR